MSTTDRSGAAKKSRQPRVTLIQHEILLSFMKANPEVYKKGSGPCHKTVKKRLLDDLAKALNDNADKGPTRDGESWIKYFGQWKGRVRNKHMHYKSACRATGGGPEPDYPLTEVDEQLLEFVGYGTSEGDPHVTDSMDAAEDDEVVVVWDSDEELELSSDEEYEAPEKKPKVEKKNFMTYAKQFAQPAKDSKAVKKEVPSCSKMYTAAPFKPKFGRTEKAPATLPPVVKPPVSGATVDQRMVRALEKHADIQERRLALIEREVLALEIQASAIREIPAAIGEIGAAITTFTERFPKDEQPVYMWVKEENQDDEEKQESVKEEEGGYD